MPSPSPPAGSGPRSPHRRRWPAHSRALPPPFAGCAPRNPAPSSPGLPASGRCSSSVVVCVASGRCAESLSCVKPTAPPKAWGRTPTAPPQSGRAPPDTSPAPAQALVIGRDPLFKLIELRVLINLPPLAAQHPIRGRRRLPASALGIRRRHNHRRRTRLLVRRQAQCTRAGCSSGPTGLQPAKNPSAKQDNSAHSTVRSADLWARRDPPVPRRAFRGNSAIAHLPP